MSLDNAPPASAAVKSFHRSMVRRRCVGSQRTGSYRQAQYALNLSFAAWRLLSEKIHLDDGLKSQRCGSVSVKREIRSGWMEI